MQLQKISFPLLLAAIFGTVCHLQGTEFHVAPGGNDSHPGTSAQPLASLAGAQRAVRALKKGKPGEPVTVLVHGGTYTMTEPLEFRPEDSGRVGAPVIFKAAEGEKPVFTGGKRIAGWKKEAGQIWTAEIPEVKDGSWYFNQLFLNGVPQIRARKPNTGFLKVAGCPEGTPKTANYHKDCQTFQFKAGDILSTWTNLQDVEVIVYHFWTDSHLPIASVDTVSNIVTFAHKAGKVFTDDFSEDGARYIVENLFEALDAPGEWYLNRRTGILYYMARAGERMADAEMVAPQVPAFMHLVGTPRERRFVEHIIFEGLTFRYSSFQLPRGNSNDQQGSASVPAAITLAGARDCVFRNCSFENLGNWAVELGKGCRGNEFRDNEISGVAAGGIRINGGTERDHPLERTGSNIIQDNHLHGYGLKYPSAVGILLMNTEANAVTHNHIYNGFYTGISVGWVWGYQRSVSQGNRIEYNHIHSIGQGLLSDMGGIYTLGVSPGTTVRNNLIHDVDANHYGGWGIYHDEGSTHLLVESNIVYRTKFAPFNIHFAKEVTVRNNIFALGKLEQVSRTRHEPHKSVFFENNIVFWKTGELFSKDWKDEPYTFYLHPKNKAGTATMTNTFDCDWNVYFNPDAALSDVKFAGGTWEDWRKRGKDTHSQYADPLLADPDHGDFTLKPASPAWAMGFQPIDTSRIGPRTKCDFDRTVPSEQGSLPDVLKMQSGELVNTRQQWLEKRRPEVLELFREHVYGRAPIGRPQGLKFSTVRTDPEAMNGRAILEQVRIEYSGPGGEGAINLVLFSPKDSKGRVPCFLLICNRDQENIDPTRRVRSPFWPAERIIERGYAAAAFLNADVAPDKNVGFREGAHKIFDTPGGRNGSSWGTIAAWAWGASRVMDYLETNRAIDSSRVAVVGHSRGGKTALWAGAEDERFAMVVSNDSGSTGAAIARGKDGERIHNINKGFPYWFAENYKRYNNREEMLPVDQHMLAGLIAPRLLYIASASEDVWADPKSEFASAVHASPVYRLFGLNGIGSTNFPLPEHPLHDGHIGYHLRTGQHNLTEYDWDQFMNFADEHLRGR